jgi:hypothetical protein
MDTTTSTLASDLILLSDAIERFPGLGSPKRWRWLSYAPERYGMEGVFVRVAGRLYVRLSALDAYLRRCAERGRDGEAA